MVTTDCEWHRPKRLRVFHAQPFSSFSRNYFKDRRWVRGSPFTEERPRNGIIKRPIFFCCLHSVDNSWSCNFRKIFFLCTSLYKIAIQCIKCKKSSLKIKRPLFWSAVRIIRDPDSVGVCRHIFGSFFCINWFLDMLNIIKKFKEQKINSRNNQMTIRWLLVEIRRRW
jgi:hypothetical protein